MKKCFIYFFLIIIFSYSCNTSYTTVYKNNRYISDSYFYYSNDSIHFAIDLFADYTYGNRPNYNNTISKKILLADRKIIKTYNPDLNVEKQNFLFKASTDVSPYYHMRAYAFPSTKNVETKIQIDSTTQTIIYSDKDSISQYILLFNPDKPIKTYKGIKSEVEQIISTIKKGENYSVSIPESPFKLALESFNQDTANYLASIKTLKYKEPNYETKDEKWFFIQAALTYNAFVEKNEEYTNLLSKLYTSDSIKTSHIDNDALNYLKSQVKNQQVVMINEQHWQSKHRFFGNKLLKFFYDNGFRYIAVEAIGEKEELALNERKYPLQSSGFYIRDPQFGNLIRNAQKLGFQIVAYDAFGKDRELKEAQNIFDKTIAKDKDAKVLVWAGIGHIIEEDSKNPKMAFHFKEISKINPLTIEQTRGDRNSVLLGNSYLAINADTTQRNKCDIFLINNIKESDYRIDPQSEDKMYTLKLSQQVKNKLKQHGSLMLSVYYKDEFEKDRLECIPVRNLLINQTDNIKLSLPKDDQFIYIIRSPFGSILESFKIF